ncbi:MAG: TIGR03087 family PEP-CTERM/XrtA system glycosyltransferase [Erythrobacter sp.]|jgi:sugar transferase (PEP-CTERM/EpsH1 system associated)|nr:TIGR03087 family PEP-CTERM/XrtA system glycosyltransferase [Erythrobacter sp.]
MSEVLFLAHRVPFPPDRGDKIRAHHLLRFLAGRARVHVGCFTENEADRAALRELAAVAASHHAPRRAKPLALAGAEAVLAGKPVSLTAFHHAGLAQWVRQTLAERPIAAIVVFSGQMGQYVPSDFAGRVIVDLCDVDSAKFEAYAAAGERVWLNRREARLLAAEEARLTARADATLLISRAEAELFEARLAGSANARIEVVGNGIDAHCFDPALVAPHEALAAQPGPHFVFTGQMDYRPNEQAALFAIDRFLPAVRAAFPAAQLHIVGRSARAGLIARGSAPGVKVWGEVPDVRPFLAGSHCVVAPLMIARGVQNKVLEAMAMACPVLLTTEAATGIDARDGAHWLVAPAEPDAMLERVRPILENAAAARSLGEEARRFVLAHHAWEACLAPLARLLDFPTSSEARNAA